jgi:hypothetical protein
MSFNRSEAHFLLQLAAIAFEDTKGNYLPVISNIESSTSHPQYQERLAAYQYYQETGFFYSDYVSDFLHLNVCDPKPDVESEDIEDPFDGRIDKEFQWKGTYHSQNTFLGDGV